jgi:rhodanese-related sulfurtransferase
MLSITPPELQKKLEAKEDIVLIDVREPFEHEDFNIGGALIPMNTIFEQIEKIPTNKTVVLYCVKGIRSTIAIQRLEEKYGYTNLINLSGGIDAWRKLTGK